MTLPAVKRSEDLRVSRADLEALADRMVRLDPTGKSLFVDCLDRAIVQEKQWALDLVAALRSSPSRVRVVVDTDQGEATYELVKVSGPSVIRDMMEPRLIDQVCPRIESAD